MTKSIDKLGLTAMCAAVMVIATGCHSPVGMAVQVVGKAVDDVETKKIGDELIGKQPSAADAKFGQPVNVLAQVGGTQKWRVYPGGSLDVIGNQRYVVQVSNGRISGISKVKIDGTGIELARKMLYDQKVTGKSPKECEAALNMGPPLLTVRSETTGMMNQLYDARMIQGLGSPKYCRLHFDPNQHCDEVQLVDVNASSGAAPPGQ